MSTHKLRVGIIGIGWYAVTKHVPALRETGRVEVVAISRRNAESSTADDSISSRSAASRLQRTCSYQLAANKPITINAAAATGQNVRHSLANSGRVPSLRICSTRFGPADH